MTLIVNIYRLLLKDFSIIYVFAKFTMNIQFIVHIVLCFLIRIKVQCHIYCFFFDAM